MLACIRMRPTITPSHSPRPPPALFAPPPPLSLSARAMTRCHISVRSTYRRTLAFPSTIGSPTGRGASVGKGPGKAPVRWRERRGTRRAAERAGRRYCLRRGPELKATDQSSGSNEQLLIGSGRGSCSLAATAGAAAAAHRRRATDRVGRVRITHMRQVVTAGSDPRALRQSIFARPSALAPSLSLLGPNPPFPSLATSPAISSPPLHSLSPALSPPLPFPSPSLSLPVPGPC
eukprot:364385-Chlamydomonas_euryale.AAC.12